MGYEMESIVSRTGAAICTVAVAVQRISKL
jgi:hypothetical protein